MKSKRLSSDLDDEPGLPGEIRHGRSLLQRFAAVVVPLRGATARWRTPVRPRRMCREDCPLPWAPVTVPFPVAVAAARCRKRRCGIHRRKPTTLLLLAIAGIGSAFRAGCRMVKSGA